MNTQSSIKPRIQTMYRQQKVIKIEASKTRFSVQYECICAACESSFMAIWQRVKYCSKTCKSRIESRKKVRPEESRVCAGCQRLFTTRKDSKSAYCGHSCPSLKALLKAKLQDRQRDKSGKLLKQEDLHNAVNQ